MLQEYMSRELGMVLSSMTVEGTLVEYIIEGEATFKMNGGVGVWDYSKATIKRFVDGVGYDTRTLPATVARVERVAGKFRLYIWGDFVAVFDKMVIFEYIEEKKI